MPITTNQPDVRWTSLKSSIFKAKNSNILLIDKMQLSPWCEIYSLHKLKFHLPFSGGHIWTECNHLYLFPYPVFHSLLYVAPWGRPRWMGFFFQVILNALRSFTSSWCDRISPQINRVEPQVPSIPFTRIWLQSAAWVQVKLNSVWPGAIDGSLWDAVALSLEHTTTTTTTQLAGNIWVQ